VPILGLPEGRAGSEDYNLRIISGLAERGHQVTAFGPACAPAVQRVAEWLPHPPRAAGSILWRVGDLVWLKQISGHVSRIGSRRWDVVLSGALPPLWAIARRWPEMPSIYVPHSMIARREMLTYAAPPVPRYVGALTYDRLQRWAWRHATGVVSSTSIGAAIRTRYYGGPPRRLHVSHFGVDADRFRPRPRDPALLESLGIPREAPVVVWAGRFSPSKDLPLLFRAFARVRTTPHPYLLVIGGDAPEWVIRIADELGIASRVRFAGFQQELERYLALGHAYVSTSALESFGLTVIQSLACGVPALVRASRYPDVLSGCAELVRDGVTGHVFTTERQLAAQLAMLLSDRAQQYAHARAARESALRDFSWNRHLDDLEGALGCACNVHVDATTNPVCANG